MMTSHDGQAGGLGPKISTRKFLRLAAGIAPAPSRLSTGQIMTDRTGSSRCTGFSMRREHH
eukprot:scaffold39334_cov67-Cyclotella_meneghiniana.AAC.7